MYWLCFDFCPTLLSSYSCEILEVWRALGLALRRELFGFLIVLAIFSQRFFLESQVLVCRTGYCPVNRIISIEIFILGHKQVLISNHYIAHRLCLFLAEKNCCWLVGRCLFFMIIHPVEVQLFPHIYPLSGIQNFCISIQSSKMLSFLFCIWLVKLLTIGTTKSFYINIGVVVFLGQSCFPYRIFVHWLEELYDFLVYIRPIS